MNNAEKFWDRLSYKFDKRSKNFEQMYIRTLELTKKYLNASDIVLDCGCATGIFAFEIAKDVKQVHGIDISSNMIEAAQRKVRERKTGNIEFTKATIFDERYSRESCDVVLAFNFLHFLDDTPKAIQRIHELLKPGGLFISTTACMGEKAFVNRFLSLLLFIPMKTGFFPSMKFFRISELEGSVRDGSFQVVETENLTHNPTNYFIAAKKVPGTQQIISPDPTADMNTQREE
jgi:2-polyprenyl-3-methyl-5-hydroxy-6-metoxy-1,4-benzoquinol methylase